MNKLLLIATLLAAPALAQEADYSGEPGYQQFVQCSSWKEENESINSQIATVNNRGSDVENEIDEYDSEIAHYQELQSKAEFWMNIQEAAGDYDGYNQNVNRYNNALENENRAHDRRNNLVDRYNRLGEDVDELIEDNDDVIANYERYCHGKTWTVEVIERACTTYNSDTSSFCEGFE